MTTRRVRKLAREYTWERITTLLETDPLGCARLFFIAHMPLKGQTSGNLPSGKPRGRASVPTPCRRCGEMQPSARVARVHCRGVKPNAMAAAGGK